MLGQSVAPQAEQQLRLQQLHQPHLAQQGQALGPRPLVQYRPQRLHYLAIGLEGEWVNTLEKVRPGAEDLICVKNSVSRLELDADWGQ
jgi:hypothetical protein